MSFISVFDVLGPNMIGPSSSHTAGAAAIALLAGKMPNAAIKKADFILYGSFARTYKGHGTDRALLGGIMGFSTDDRRIPDSFSIADERGLQYSFTANTTETEIHPNTVDIHMTDENGQKLIVRGESVGGGKIRIARINEVEVDFTGEYSTLIVIQQDKPGVIAHITNCLSEMNVNIAYMKLYREDKGCTAYSIVESDGIINQMGKTWQIMKESAHSSVENPKHSIGGLIGGEAKLLSEHLSSGKSICKDPLSRAITYSMSILETSASMGLIVAAPTAGSAGIVPGLLLALQETYDFSDNDIIRVLFNAGAVGCLAMRNATVAGAVGGCQAEVGVASAMAASAAVELMQGTARQCLDAASTVLMNMLGLVCDPVGGLVECPCQMRNASGVANALTAAEIVLSGVRQLIPFDEMLDAMYTAGKRLPAEYRETALGGCAATSTGCSLCQ